jgi:hypothetical protein
LGPRGVSNPESILVSEVLRGWLIGRSIGSALNVHGLRLVQATKERERERERDKEEKGS